MIVAAPAAPTLIAALHQRFETVEAANHIADVAQPNKGDDSTRYYALERAMHDLSAESDLIRRLILLQPPIDDADLTLVAFHVWLLVDRIDSFDMPDKDDKIALRRGVQQIFNYLVSAGRVEMEKVGKCFSDCAILAFNAEQDRCGEPAEGVPTAGQEVAA
jgi:hypothetical protein